MKSLLIAAALAVGLMGVTTGAAEARHWDHGWHGYHHERHCRAWGWHRHHERWCRRWDW